MTEPIGTHEIIGIIGGGQLGRMLAMAAAQLGYRCHIFTPENDSPASQVAWKTTVADYADADALRRFGTEVAVVTCEFENVPAEALAALEEVTRVRPGADVLKTCRNRAREKAAINRAGVETAAYRHVTSEVELQSALAELGTPAFLKTCEMGYDGKGQIVITQTGEAVQAWQALGSTDAVLEGRVDFACEISVIVARREDGVACCYLPTENHHKNQILDRSIIPANIRGDVAQQAEEIALQLAEKLNVVGLLAVEMFVCRDGSLKVNELAPRPHNSGHWTMDAAKTSQFEQCIRAICHLPLGSADPLCPAKMVNLIGDDVQKAGEYLSNPHASVHLYGKTETRPGRKMGHVNILKPEAV